MEVDIYTSAISISLLFAHVMTGPGCCANGREPMGLQIGTDYWKTSHAGYTRRNGKAHQRWTYVIHLWLRAARRKHSVSKASSFPGTIPRSCLVTAVQEKATPPSLSLGT